MTGVSPSRNTAIVLVVEDEPLQRLDMIDMLERAGFEVVEAANAAIAVALLESRSDIGLVLTDIDMPGGMDGLNLAAAVRRRWPPIHVIVTTAGISPTPDQLPPQAVFLPKPLNYTRVIGTLHAMAC